MLLSTVRAAPLASASSDINVVVDGCGDGNLDIGEECDPPESACSPACESSCNYCGDLCTFVTLHGGKCSSGGGGSSRSSYTPPPPIIIENVTNEIVEEQGCFRCGDSICDELCEDAVSCPFDCRVKEIVESEPEPEQENKTIPVPAIEPPEPFDDMIGTTDYTNVARITAFLLGMLVVLLWGRSLIHKLANQLRNRQKQIMPEPTIIKPEIEYDEELRLEKLSKDLKKAKKRIEGSLHKIEKSLRK